VSDLLDNVSGIEMLLVLLAALWVFRQHLPSANDIAKTFASLLTGRHR
jgi:hypothetical protein